MCLCRESNEWKFALILCTLLECGVHTVYGCIARACVSVYSCSCRIVCEQKCPFFSFLFEFRPRNDAAFSAKNRIQKNGLNCRRTWRLTSTTVTSDHITIELDILIGCHGRNGMPIEIIFIDRLQAPRAKIYKLENDIPKWPCHSISRWSRCDQRIHKIKCVMCTFIFLFEGLLMQCLG